MCSSDLPNDVLPSCSNRKRRGVHRSGWIPFAERKYAEGEWILVREKWDNPSGAGSNFAFGTESKEPLDKGIERTVVFIKGETTPGQDLFIRGGVDHEASKKLRGIDCQNEDGSPNLRCAIQIGRASCRERV